MKCPSCGCEESIKAGLNKTPKGIFQKYRCNKCFRTFKGEKVAEVNA